MHEELVKMNVKRVLERLSQGDCPIAAALPTETLEFVIQHQSSRIDALERELAQANEDKIAIRAFRDAAVEAGDAFAEKLVIAEDALAALRARTLAVIGPFARAEITFKDCSDRSGFCSRLVDGNIRYDMTVGDLRAARALEDELKGGANVVSR